MVGLCMCGGGGDVLHVGACTYVWYVGAYAVWYIVMCGDGRDMGVLWVDLCSCVCICEHVVPVVGVTHTPPFPLSVHI